MNSRMQGDKDDTWRKQLFEIIFEADTPAGRFFDVVLIACIVLSVVIVMLDSIAGVNRNYGFWLMAIEWAFTLLFTIEYILRLVCVGRPLRYAVSFFGLIDLLAILPTYLSLFFPGSHYLIVIRVLRVLRVFRVLKLAQFVGEENRLTAALWQSRRKISIFILTVLTLVVIIGSIMYLVEGPENGFTSIPQGIYWSIVTLTTVGYGDISPRTDIGKTIVAIVMILGYGIIAVPTGIVTAEMVHTHRAEASTQVCPECTAGGHDTDAIFCRRCGTRL